MQKAAADVAIEVVSYRLRCEVGSKLRSPQEPLEDAARVLRVLDPFGELLDCLCHEAVDSEYDESCVHVREDLIGIAEEPSL